ncbi:MAG: hypothetical protein IJS08_10080 [Victivallales bacterium]|nr:hypothetical protein [Victivallales bacterium]
MVFDDTVNNGGRLFTEADAKAIFDFVCDDTLPILVHCTAGIARSGAIGDVQDVFFNRCKTQNDADHQFFLDNTPQIMPNTTVHRLMMRELYARI